MKNLGTIFICIALVLSIVIPVRAADVNNGLNDQIVSPTTPAITGKAVDGQIRVLEFVIGSRMTLAQKQVFVKAIIDESKTMTTDQLEDFLEVNGLVDSLNQLNRQDAEPVRQLLEKDFIMTAKSLEKQKDLAATQFLKIRDNLRKKVVGSGDSFVTRQSIEAFAEYLAFIANTKNPIWPNELSTNATAMRVRTNYNKYTEDEREALEDFQLTWYLIRAAWQTADAKQKEIWQKNFNKIGIKPGADVTSDNIKAALDTDIYADMLDFATKKGIEAIEWSPKTNVYIW